MPRIKKEPVQVYNAAAATGHGTVIDVEDYRHVVVAVSATLNSSLTFKFKASPLSRTQTDLTTAQTVDNIWDYVSSYDLMDPGTLITGDFGVTINNTSVVVNTTQYLINTDHMAQFAIEVTAYTDGALDAWVIAAND